MNRTRLAYLLFAAALAASGPQSQHSEAAFIAESRSGGKAFANFSYGGDTTTSSNSTVTSAAVGLTAAIGSVFGGNGATADTYVFAYTPGVDADNTTYAAGAILGSTTNFPGQGNVATGATGGATGLYNVYFTAPESTNVANPSSDFTITQNGAPLVLEDVNLNNTGTGPDTDPGTAFVGGANNAWFKLGTVLLNAGSTYTVTQTSNGTGFVSQRSSAVMWEAVGIPEPTTFAIAAFAGLAGIGFSRRSTICER